MIIKRSSLAESYAWTFGSRCSDITDKGAFICACWSRFTGDCFSRCFAEYDNFNFNSIVFDVMDVRGIFASTVHD